MISLSLDLKMEIIHTTDCSSCSSKVSKVGDCSQGQPEGYLFNSYNTEV